MTATTATTAGITAATASVRLARFATFSAYRQSATTYLGVAARASGCGAGNTAATASTANCDAVS